MATYQERKDRGCWIARVYDPSTGRERTKTFGRGVGKRKAAELAPGVIAELQATVAANVANRGTVKEYATTWLERRRTHLSPTTIAGGYEPIVRRIVKEFGRARMTDVTPQQVETWYFKLHAEGKSPATVERHHQVMRAIFRKAVRDRVIVQVPTDVDRPKAEPTNINLPATVAVRNATATLGGDFGNFFRLLVLTGMRRGELIALAWADIEPLPPIDGERRAILHVRRAAREAYREVTIGPTKSKRTRKVRIGEEAMMVLDAQLASVREQLGRRQMHGATPIFPDFTKDRTGKTPHRPGWASEWWERIRGEHGMDGVRLHDLRHHHATSLLEDGVPLNLVSARLGHSLASTTLNIYGHATDHGDELAVKSSARLALPRTTDTTPISSATE